MGIERNGDYNKEIALPRLKKYIPTIELKIIEKVPEVIEEVIQEIIQNVVEEQGEEEYTEELLKKKKCPELKKICKSKKIKCYSRKRKNELIKLILNHKN